MQTASLDTPVGPIFITAEDDAITRLGWGVRVHQSSPVLDRAISQLRAYFAGELTEFDLPLRVDASPFQQQVCAEMLKIPFGETCTYGDLARLLGVAAQPIGRACGGNPIPIIIPCHRVMGAGGKLVGFSGEGGVETKVALLCHEGAAGLLI